MQTKEIGGRNLHISNNLPPRPDLFVDREDEIHQATVALLEDEASVVALVGMAGIGKTWLALEIAHRLLEKGEFKGGIIWLPASGLQSLDDLTGKIGAVLGVPTSEVYRRLYSQPCLLVLDGLDENPSFLPEATRFLEGLPDPSKVLITGRQGTPLPSQSIVLQVGAFDEQTAVELFAALADRSGAEVPAEERRRISEIVGALGYHPLALTLAANLVQGDYAEARKMYQQALDVFTERGAGLERAAMLHALATLLANLGSAYAALGEIHRAIELYEQALTIAREIGDKRSLSTIPFELGRIYVEQGRWYDGLQLLEESLAVRRQGEDLGARADVIYQIACTHHLMGNFNEARIRYRDALRLYQRTGNQRGIAACRTGLGHLAIQAGWLDDALPELEQARKLYVELNDKQNLDEIEELLHLANRIRERQPA